MSVFRVVTQCGPVGSPNPSVEKLPSPSAWPILRNVAVYPQVHTALQPGRPTSTLHGHNVVQSVVVYVPGVHSAAKEGWASVISARVPPCRCVLWLVDHHEVLTRQVCSPLLMSFYAQWALRGTFSKTDWNVTMYRTKQSQSSYESEYALLQTLRTYNSVQNNIEFPSGKFPFNVMTERLCQCLYTYIRVYTN
jgi:hypothetical protein